MKCFALIAAIWASMFMPTSATASHFDLDGLCHYPRAGTLAMFLNVNPDAKLIGNWRDADAKDLIRVYNEWPPPTDYVSDEVLVYNREDWGNVFFILIHEDCIAVGSEIPLQVYLLWVRGLWQEAS